MSSIKVGNGESATEYLGERPHNVIRPVQSYATSFPTTESVLSERGMWGNGLADGLDWQDCAIVSGRCSGTGHASTSPPYDDCTSVLKGTWGPNQTVFATVTTTNQQAGGSIFEEVELRLRSVITPHVCNGYEITFRCTNNGYVQINLWNGPLNSFTQLWNTDPGPGIATGDVLKATIIGSQIKIYKNNVQIGATYDTIGDAIRFDSGNPGLGMFLQGAAASFYNDYGFTQFTAQDG